MPTTEKGLIISVGERLDLVCSNVNQSPIALRALVRAKICSVQVYNTASNQEFVWEKFPNWGQNFHNLASKKIIPFRE